MLTFRQATDADLVPAMEIMLAAWKPIFEGFREQIGDELYNVFYAGWEQPKAERISRALQSDHGCVAELDGRIVGFAHWLTFPGSDIAYLSENAVASDLRGKGIGGQIYNYVFDRMRAEGCKYVRVSTGLDDAHAPARRAYEKAGFSHTLPDVDYFMPLRDAITGTDPCMRPAAEADVERACDIAVQAWTPIRVIFRENHLGELYSPFFDGWQASKRASVARAMRGGRGYVAEVEGRVAGFISYTVNPERKSAEIGENAVDSSMRGHGIGGKQYACIFDRMRAEGIEYVKVHTGLDDGHAPARRAYEKAGFDKRIPHVTYYRAL
ncbi:MAG: GNAT family N-acetyltransferase [Ruminococcaceae bacterium]|nr:GNAT family N-acetyltransferase [Oscillospiraceae bacterium]